MHSNTPARKATKKAASEVEAASLKLSQLSGLN